MSERIGVVGLGKLGLPFAVTLAQDYPVVGYDEHPRLRCKRPYEHRERGPAGGDDFQERFDKSKLSFAGTLSELATATDIVFVLVQTPHAPRFSGEKRLSEDRADFDYYALRRVAGQLASCVRPDHVVAVVSTVLPGTMRREVLPILGGKCRVVYNPAFPAMGTVMQDLLEPEFVLLGGGDRGECDRNGLWELSSFWQRFYMAYGQTKYDAGEWEAPYGPPGIHTMSYESAELAKVAYNCAISQRIAYVNALGEICHKVPGCDVGAVTGVLKAATKRIASPRYMDAGMGDGGACHPRDGIAMSWLAGKLDLAHDPFSAAMQARERQTTWLARIVESEAARSGLPIVLLGKSYKPESVLTAGSPALLLADILRFRGVGFVHYDPYVDDAVGLSLATPAVFALATRHDTFAGYQYPRGSVVVDPFRMVPDRDGVRVVRIGVGPKVGGG